MYQVSRVQTALSGLIGWKQPTLDFFTLSASNTDSSSGLYMTDFSTLLEVQNIAALQGDAEINQAEFNAFLADIVKSAMVKVCNALFSVDDFCESKWLFTEENVWTNVLANDAKFVGYEITPPRGKYLVMINTVQTTFDAVDSVKLLLFHSSKKSPLQTKTITTVANDTVETALGWTLPYDYGKYYIGYLRGGLTAKAVDRDSDAGLVQSFKTIKVQEVEIPHTTETLFDIDDLSDTSDTYGLNFNISTYKDYTWIVEQNKSRFVNALGLQAAVDVADLIIKSTRSNFTERNLRGVAMMEKEGLISNDPNAPKVNSLVQKLKAELRDLQRSLLGNDWIKKGTL